MMRIRLARPGDGPALAAIYRPAVAKRATSFEIDPPDGDEMARRVAATLPARPWLACEAGGDRVVGYAYASRHRDRAAYQWCVEVSAYVDGAWQRRGIGRGLYESLFAVLELLGYRNAYAGVTLPNPASEGLHAAVGFTPVGVYRGVGWKLGAWHDVLWLERRLGGAAAAPASLLAVDAIAPERLAAALGSGESRLMPGEAC